MNLDLGLEFKINYKGHKKLPEDLKVIRSVFLNKENNSSFCEDTVQLVSNSGSRVPVGRVLLV